MYSTTLFENPLTFYKEAFTNGTYGTLTSQIQNMSSIGSTYNDISGNITSYDSLKSTLENDQSRYIDFSGNYLAYTDSKRTVKDAVKEDIHTMIMQQNNAYIMGMVALSAVLITTFLFLKK